MKPRRRRGARRRVGLTKSDGVGPRLERLVARAPMAAWVKLEDGRFQALSRSFASGLGVSTADARRIRDQDFFSGEEVLRFREHDRRVLAGGLPQVILEPPDSLTPAAWGATLKVPLAGYATAGFSLSLDTLAALEGFLVSIQGVVAQLEGRSVSARTRAHLDERFRTRVRVSRIATEMRRHPDHLARSFRQDFGVTIAKYLKARRVAWAATQLADPRRAVAEIALDSGFYDQSHLTHAFRAILGTTPGEYRRARIAPKPFQRLAASRDADPMAMIGAALHSALAYKPGGDPQLRG